jgi:hypothetical protein
MIDLSLKIKILDEIDKSKKVGLSTEYLEKKYNLHLYLIKSLSEEFQRLGLIKAINTKTKDTIYSELLLINPKGNFLLKNPKALKKLLRENNQSTLESSLYQNGSKIQSNKLTIKRIIKRTSLFINKPPKQIWQIISAIIGLIMLIIAIIKFYENK